MLEEGLEAQRRLLTDDKASFKGQYYEFANISIYPKPLQKPFPIYLGGVHIDSARRVAQWCTGWIMSVATTLETLEDRINRLEPLLEERGRNISEIDLAIVAVHSIARNHKMAVKKFKNSRIVKRSSGQDIDDFVQRNLIGSPIEIAEKVKNLEQKGITHIFLSNHANENFEDLLEQVQMLGEEVLPQFRTNQGL
jgi:alkanesulfonate monooxygenase SsuD/methylene tetrahydromethanopterin reductase-like flavin-dependent oxidoreductase (luciferase family)